MTLSDLLKADAARQLHFAGASGVVVGTLRLVRMLLSFRFAPVVLYRFSYWCAHHHLRPLGKLLSLTNFIVFGLEIAADCDIGAGLFFPHTIGTVIGARKIGVNAVIYHNVTLGAKEPDLAYDPLKRPELGDHVFVGAGAKVLGGIVLGDRAVVAANAVVLEDVPSGALVGGIPARILQRR